MSPIEYKVLEFVRKRTDRDDVDFGPPTVRDMRKWINHPDAASCLYGLEINKYVEVSGIKKPRSMKRYLITEAGRNLLRAAP